MFLRDVQKKEECRTATLNELRKRGIKRRPKELKLRSVKNVNKVFRVPLHALPTEVVTLKTGQQVPISKVIHQMCLFILTKPGTEGLFRKEGSKPRQAEMRLILDGGGVFDSTYQIVDVATLFKTFLRELPEPVIPRTHHELFLRCVFDDIDNKTEALLLACLLLPIPHLDTLTYLLQFLHTISQYCSKNKMSAYNLAVVFGPAIFPVEGHMTPAVAKARTTKVLELIEILIVNAHEVGVLPGYVIESVAATSDAEEKKRKKRRSGSLTRMFNGLKKIVGGKSVEENHNVVTPDLLLTPVNVIKKKRNYSNGISVKKKQEIMSRLPENVLLSAPFTPRTPVSMDLSGDHQKFGNAITKEKRWFSRSRSLKNLKQEETCKKTTAKGLLERRWSAINPSSNIKRTKKRNSFSATSSKETKTIEEIPEPDYIRVPKIEFEAIKTRVSAMERRLSLELEHVQSQISTEKENNRNEKVDTNIRNVQTAYEQTLVSAQLSPTTDHLARRLSRELKIRRSADQKIIRSPSARKIGSMRRKSREFDKSAKLTRHKSWHVPPSTSIPRVSLKRGKPNTLSTGLRSRMEDEPNTVVQAKTRSTSVGEESMKNLSCNLSGSSDTWVSAEGFFTTVNSNNSSAGDGNSRASIAKLRSQNAGMVLAKAKLFDKLSDSDSSNSLRTMPRPKTGNKIGSTRNMDTRLSYRVRNLKYEERRIGKKSMSPRRRAQSVQKQKIQLAKYLNSGSEKYSNKENMEANIVTRVDSQFSSPKTPSTPCIKRPLNFKSPKRLCRTPLGLERGTPLRVLKTPLGNI